MTYAEQVEVVKAVYEPRILGLLNRIGAELEEAGFEVEGPDDFTDEEYVWGIGIPLDRDACDWIDVRFTLAESKVREDGEDGIAYHLGITRSDGLILGDFSPYNYTPEVWVPLDDPEAIEERFHLMEQVEGIVECLEGALA